MMNIIEIFSEVSLFFPKGHTRGFAIIYVDIFPTKQYAHAFDLYDITQYVYSITSCIKLAHQLLWHDSAHRNIT